VQAAVRELRAGQLQWAADLVPAILADMAARREQREQTGRAVTGLQTGIRRLDDILNGLNEGLIVLGGGPGVGKTTFCVQASWQVAAAGTPVIYVTYENSPANLVLKSLAAQAGVEASQIERGLVDAAPLAEVAQRQGAVLRRWAVLEGTSRLTVAQIRAKALGAMNHHKAERCLIIMDYLQRAAHGLGYDQLRANVSGLAGDLRELATRLGSPVLAISSQNRAAGNYGGGKGSATLDSLKESGDLEYSADAVLFLHGNDQRRAIPPAQAVDLVVGKNRFGAQGTVPLIFRADLGTFREEQAH
jgi:replicative DNA helicase